MNSKDTSGSSLQRSGIKTQKEKAYKALLLFCAIFTVIITVGIVVSLIDNTFIFFSQISPIEFFTGVNWHPLTAGEYGVLPLVTGTLIITVGSAVIALPIGLAAAIYLSEYASEAIRAVLKPALEILAGVPTIVYGYFALVYITPLLKGFIPAIQPFNALSASIVVGIMIIPMVSSISEDALDAVPDSLRQAGYGVGSSKFDVSTKIVVPSAFSGIISSYVLAISRAIGETMAVTLAAGQSPHMPYFPNIIQNLTESTQTMTAAMVQIAGAESLGQTAAYDAMFAIGITLFVMTFSMNLLAEYIRNKFQEKYK